MGDINVCRGQPPIGKKLAKKIDAHFVCFGRFWHVGFSAHRKGRMSTTLAFLGVIDHVDYDFKRIGSIRQSDEAVGATFTRKSRFLTISKNFLSAVFIGKSGSGNSILKELASYLKAIRRYRYRAPKVLYLRMWCSGRSGDKKIVIYDENYTTFIQNIFYETQSLGRNSKEVVYSRSRIK